MTERTELLIGGDNLDKLRQACVMVAGLGGVGAFAAEAIVRGNSEGLNEIQFMNFINCKKVSQNSP